jgi:hypothetical protein
MSTSDTPETGPPIDGGINGAALASAPANGSSTGADEPPESVANQPKADLTARPRASVVPSLILGFIAGLVGGAAVFGLLAVAGPGRATQSEISALKANLAKADVASLDARIHALEAKLVQNPPAQGVAALAARLQSAEQQVAALSSRLGTFEGAPPGVGVPAVGGDFRALGVGLATSVTELKGRVDALAVDVQAAHNLAVRIAALETRVPADLGAELTALAAKGDMAALAARITKLEANTSAFDAKRAASAIALANLARAASSGGPFAPELEAVRLLNADPDIVGPIAAYATHGVRPVAQLAAEFDGVRNNALRAAGRGSGNWWERFWASLAGLFVIRSEGPRAGDSIDAVLSRAQAASNAGNLQDAVSELAKLKGPAVDVVAAWRAQAAARITLDSLLTKLSARILADLHG